MFYSLCLHSIYMIEQYQIPNKSGTAVGKDLLCRGAPNVCDARRGKLQYFTSQN